jgi:capsular exopolysaccharide synthesis family protein
MSKFFEALEQAERDRALRESRGRSSETAPAAVPEPATPEEDAKAPAVAPAAPQATVAPAVPAVDEPPARPAAARPSPPPVEPRRAEAPARPEPKPVPVPRIERVAMPAPERVVTPAPPERPAPPRPEAPATVPARPAAERAPRPAAPVAAPVAHGADAPRMDEHLVSLLSPGSMEAEQYRALRHLIEQFHKTAGLTVMVVTSPGIGDGKTTTAINLAGALAQDPAARVLLADADFRGPSVLARLGLDAVGGRGLADAILDPGLSLDAIVRHAAPFNLSVLAAGRRPGVPYELLASPRFGELLESARALFDYVILDSPPLVLFPDCQVVGQWVDGFLLVIGADRTPRKMVEEALNLFEPDKLVGLVFNGDDRPLSGYGADSYAYRQPDPGGANGSGPGWFSRRRGRQALANRAGWRS